MCVCVCLCVCLLSASISLEPIVATFRVHPLWPCFGPPLAALRYVMYFWFMNDLTFGRNGPYGETRRLNRYATATSGVAIPRRSLDVYECLFLMYDHDSLADQCM